MLAWDKVSAYSGYLLPSFEMKNQILCYFDDLENLQSSNGLNDIWHESWRKYGWEPRVSNHTWLPDHPRHEEVQDHVKTLPTVNPRNYEEACYLRWLPAETSGARFFTDMDVICNGLRPEHLEALCQTKAVSLIHNGCPAAVYMPPHFPIHEWILRYKPHHAWPENGQPHCSDQNMFLWLVQHKRESFVSIDLCKDYGDKGWESAPLIHFPTGACARHGGGRHKRQIIKDFLGMP